MTLREYLKSFGVLKQVRREYWGVQAISLIDCLYAFSSVTVATVFMSSSLGFSDVAAGAVITWLGIVTSLFLFVVGPVVDRIGVRKSLYSALFGALAVRGLLTLSAFWTAMPFRSAVFVGCLVIGCLPGALKSTANHVSNRRFTTKESQAAGFNVWYVVVNVGAAGAGLLIDLVKITLKLEFTWIFAFGVVSAVLALPIAFLFIRNDEPSPDEALPAKKPAIAGREWQDRWQYAKDVMRHAAFLRMMSAVTLLTGVRAAFLYWTVLSPKYWYRAIGPDARVGMLSTINPIVIVVGLFLLVPIINRFSTFKMLTVGALISGASFLPLTVPWHWVHGDPTTAYYLMSGASMLTFAVGEMLFSPRLSNYIIAIAPLGQEGAYSSFAAMPWFIGKTVAGFASGILLVRWCPETVIVNGASVPLAQAIADRQIAYADSPEMMWLILGAFALAGPIIMLFFRKWFTTGMRDNPTPS